MTTELYTVAGNFGFTWVFTLQESDGSAFDLSGSTVAMNIQEQGTEYVRTVSMSPQSPLTGGVVKYIVQADDFPKAGRYNCDVVVTFGDATVTFSDMVVVAEAGVPRN